MQHTSPQPMRIGSDFFRHSAFWETFHHATAQVGETRLHYVEGGTGSPLLLIPGWPQSWYAWRYVMPGLAAAGHRVIALDPRGMGESDAPVGAYDLTTVAAEIQAFAKTTGLLDTGPLDVAGHDVGAWIAYALATDHRTDIHRLAVLDALVPGLSAPRADLPHHETILRSWHFAFNQLNELPELLISGREEIFLTWLFRAKSIHGWTIAPEDIAVYARQLAAPGAIRAAGSYYQSAFSPEGIATNRKRAESQLEIPVLALGAERGVGTSIVTALQALARSVQGSVIENAGHYLPEEAANRVVDELAGFFR